MRVSRVHTRSRASVDTVRHGGSTALTGFVVTDVPDCLDRDRVRVEPNATYRLDERVRIRGIRSVAEAGRLVPVASHPDPAQRSTNLSRR